MSERSYVDNLSEEQLLNLDRIVKYMGDVGITNKYAQAAMLSVCTKESGLIPKSESSYRSTSSSRIRKIFGKNVSDLTDGQIDEIKKNDIDFFDKVYGINSKRERQSDGSVYGNISSGDGYKYRGRGYNQITFKGTYRDLGEKIGVDLVSNPDLLVGDVAAKALVNFFIKSFKGSKTQALKSFGASKSSNPIQTMNKIDNLRTACQCFYQANAGWGKWEKTIKYENSLKEGPDGLSFSDDIIGGYTRTRNLAPIFYQKIGGDPTVDPPVQDDPDENENIPIPQSNSDQNYDDESHGDPSPPSGSVSKLNKFFDPKISPSEIVTKIDHLSEQDKNKISKGLGFAPFVWYNGIQISSEDISKLSIRYQDTIPVMNIVFEDSFGIMKQDGFPLDDSIITVFINSRSKLLRSIKMDFKILSFKDFGSSMYSIDGCCNVPKIFIKKFQSLPKKTSHECLRDISVQTELGFCSNVDNTDDKMTWINPGNSQHDFIGDVVSNSYSSDSSYFYYYIDFYYNLCFVDIPKELERNIINDLMVNSFGYIDTDTISDDDSEKLIPLILTNDISSQSSVSYFSDYEIINKSTRVSIQNSYSTKSVSYNSLNKEILQFDVRSMTSDGKKTILLKGNPNDNSDFFKENINHIWLGKEDFDNSHKNYNYSKLQNRINLNEISKIGSVLTIPSPNFNLYKFQKITVLFSARKRTPTHKEQFYKRLTGEWLITDIEFLYESGNVVQKIKIIKTELSMTNEEIESSVKK